MKKVTRYHFWNAETKEYLGDTTATNGDVEYGGNYVHQTFEIEIPDFPEPPKKELLDGVYYCLDDAGGDPVIMVRKDAKWFTTDGYSRDDDNITKIIGRIPVEPVEGVKS